MIHPKSSTNIKTGISTGKYWVRWLNQRFEFGGIIHKKSCKNKWQEQQNSSTMKKNKWEWQRYVAENVKLLCPESSFPLTDAFKSNSTTN